uniref:Uncharacterized protein n=1 Tax=Acanthochromis polyacanthus TaxID=80966 RepID=A0A3Q1FEM0_9TELE
MNRKKDKGFESPPLTKHIHQPFCSQSTCICMLSEKKVCMVGMSPFNTCG